MNQIETFNSQSN